MSQQWLQSTAATTAGRHTFARRPAINAVIFGTISSKRPAIRQSNRKRIAAAVKVIALTAAVRLWLSQNTRENAPNDVIPCKINDTPA